MLSSLITGIFTITFLVTVIRLTTPILFAALSSFAAATTGIGNIAVEGIMTMSALFGILGSYWTQNAWLGLLIGLVSGISIALLIAFFSMKMGADATLVGIALNTFSDSLAVFLLYQFTGDKGSSASLPTPTLATWDLPVLKNIPVVSDIFSGHYAITYFCWILIILFYILIYKTPLGMRMRSCGLNPDAAKTAGINVQRLQVLSLIFSGLFAAFGGMYLSLNYLKIYSKQMVAGQGWMGIAANGIANGNYGGLLLSSVIFGAFRAITITFSTNAAFPTDLLGAVPYFAVFVILTAVSIINTMRAKKGNVSE